MPGTAAVPGPGPEICSASTATGLAIASEYETLPPRQRLPHAGDGSLHLPVEDLLALLAGRRARVRVRRDDELRGWLAVEGCTVDDSVVLVAERPVPRRQRVEAHVFLRDRQHGGGLLGVCVARVAARW